MINNKAREISATPFSDTQAQINNALLSINKMQPAIIMSYDAETRTVTAQVAIQREFVDENGDIQSINIPPCVDVPVVFPSGGGYEITFPVKEGDECILIFADRCIDAWHASGEISPPADYRQHDLSDAIAIVGVKSIKNVTATDEKSMKIGNAENKISINDDGVVVNIGKDNKIAAGKNSIEVHVGDKSKVLARKDSIVMSVDKALLTLTKDKLTSNVVIHCPNLITSKFDTNNHVHSGVETGIGDTLDGKNVI